jgi:hypothetical protein
MAMNAARTIAPVVLLLALDVAEARAANGADAVIRAADLQADVAILRRAYETLHPGLYRYNTAAQIDAAFRALERDFRQDRTLAEAYLAFSVFAAKIRCGHTYPNFSNQSKGVRAALFEEPRVPFYFRWLGERMIVTRSFAADARLRAGTEVLSINGIPVAKILARLMTVARADGSNDASRVALLQVEGVSRLEAFDVYWPLLFPSAAPDVTLRVREPDARRARTIRVPPLTPAARLSAFEAAAKTVPGKDAPIWQFTMLEGGLGHLRMPTWVLYNSTWNWRAFLDETFALLAANGATNLVIDLRGNEGGTSAVGDVLVSHLIAAPVPGQAVTRFVSYRKVPDDLLAYLDTWDPSFKDWGEAAIEPTGRLYRLRRSAADDPGGAIAPAAPRFAGRTWVLVGPANSSATFQFADTVRQNRLGTLVGQPTGGNQRGTTGGAFFFLRLRHSGLELDLPLIGQYADGDRPDAGLQPDVLVVPTAHDIAAGRDVELDAVQARIRLRR